MDNNYDGLIKSFRDKIKRIINLYEAEKEKSAELQKQVQVFESKFNRVKKDYNALETRYNNLKIAKTITVSAKDEHDAKLKVNNIVREIDKCIALLNR